eukprot:CAMPEP_0115007638 /NCGR_PEP_ID=MMETSP0216-20121206/21329_1 /TAXON_ID=223996 /ORGANISM="Protocruzia adherens, Strain Boccale" /LENGTH=471 /DNA_ID=CAMNT_0002374679 /DNA_START=438 /DNA_END=1853 /DNA_ORIENTATION=-
MVLTKIYHDYHLKNLTILEFQENDLRGRCTTRTDLKKGLDHFPPEIRTAQVETSQTELQVDDLQSQKLQNRKDSYAQLSTIFEHCETEGGVGVGSPGNMKYREYSRAVSSLSGKATQTEEFKQSQGILRRINTLSDYCTTSYSHDGSKVSVTNFEVLKLIRKGQFAKLMLVQHKSNQKVYAMKVYRKDVVVDSEFTEILKKDKDLTIRAKDSRFVIPMYFVFHNDARVFIINEFATNGDVFSLLLEHVRIKEEVAKFLIAQCVLFLEHMHKQDLVYRDLKPENMLLSSKGYLWISDFSMSQRAHDGFLPESLYATPEYLAPEVIETKRANRDADWWSLGVLLYELLVGATPFFNKDLTKMIELIKHSDVRFPLKHQISQNANDLIRRLLVKDSKLRLGAQGNVEDIKNHQFFDDIDFDRLAAGEVPSPLLDFYPQEDVELESLAGKDEAAFSLVPPGRVEMLRHNHQFEDF